MFARYTTLYLLAALTLFTACGDDSTTNTTDEAAISRTVIGDGDIGSGPFFTTAEGPAGSGLTFTLRGDNLRYENERLVADFTAINDGDSDVPLPAVLTLVTLDPDSVGVDGADNGVMGAGASFDLDFAEEDLLWNVGEESLPETLAFDVGPGVSIAFVARIDFALDVVGGSIGGTVYEDVDEDGVFDGEEVGVGGVGIELVGGDIRMRTRSTEDGTYRFDGLAAGVYTVTKLPARRVTPTTDTSIQVLLVENEDGTVVDYLNADFGCRVADVPPARSTLEEGDFVEVTGRYRDGTLIAYEIEIEDDDDFGQVRGPVTGVDVENGSLAIMGIHLAVDGLHLEGGGRGDLCREGAALDLEIGDRARAWLDGEVDAATDSTSALYGAERMKCWSGDKEKVYGAIESILRNDDDVVIGLTVLGLDVVVTDRTECRHDDDEDDDDRR